MRRAKQNNYSMKNFLLLTIFVISIFFSQLLFKNLLPIPSDTIVGLYYPFRDLYSETNPNGIPFKNFLITDPVRQIIPWKVTVIESISNLKLPIWNPYEMTGKPLIGNFQSGAFYPLNILLFVKPFYLSWSLFILLQVFLSGIFMYFYLNNFKLDKKAILFGVVAFCFSGFFTSWFEWGNIVHTALWLPLVLLSIDKILTKKAVKKLFVWDFVFIAAMVFSFFAGHLQIFIYLFIFSFIYFIARWIQYGFNKFSLFWFLGLYILVLLLTAVQWISSLNFILISARSVDQAEWAKAGWFIPWQHLVQFIVPDFFGNPTTLNYWGTWNYAELIGYVGVAPFIFAMLCMYTRIDRKTFFFGTLFFTSLFFALPTYFAKIPYILNVPFLASSQPTRLLFITCFSLSILAALGLDYFLKNYINLKKHMLILFVILLIVFSSLWFFVLYAYHYFPISPDQAFVAKRNLLFPTILFVSSYFFVFLFFVLRSKKKYIILLTVIILAILIFDMYRFFIKFNSFTDKKYFFPTTNIINYLKKDKGVFRIASNDSRILPPNFATYYKLQSIEGYDPLYLLSYAELIAASERGKPEINPPFGFNRIITPHNIDSKIIDLLNVKYVLSLTELKANKLKKVFADKQTSIYENKNAFDRTFFVENIIIEKDKQEVIEKMFVLDLKKTAVVQASTLRNKKYSLGKAVITEYNENDIVIDTENEGEGFLVLTDAYYPTWRAKIDGKMVTVYKTNYTFRGIVVPKGKHKILFYTSLL